MPTRTMIGMRPGAMGGIPATAPGAELTGGLGDNPVDELGIEETNSLAEYVEKVPAKTRVEFLRHPHMLWFIGPPAPRGWG